MVISRKLLFMKKAGGLVTNMIEKKIYADAVIDEYSEKFKEKERR
jgi:hypothetical protein